MNRTGNLGASFMLLALVLCAPLQACADGRNRSAAGMTTAPSKVNGSGVTVQYRVDPLPQAGQATSIVLSFDGITDPAGATVQLRSDAGLKLGSAATTRTLPAGEVSNWTVEVVPAAQGIGYLHVFTTQNGTTSSISIPVQVGKAPPSMPSMGELKAGPGTEKILSMPVK
ncbi:hypothetical protein SRS16CHR_01867 [Variovorax sp. SRS16]|nr:hypothetical protein SRS16CHR_01867 [Variovorax sp. SRS16]